MIGGSAFHRCESLASIDLPQSLAKIGYHAFEGCSRLSTVRFKGSQALWNQVADEGGNEPLKDAKIVFNAP